MQELRAREFQDRSWGLQLKPARRLRQSLLVPTQGRQEAKATAAKLVEPVFPALAHNAPLCVWKLLKSFCFQQQRGALGERCQRSPRKGITGPPWQYRHPKCSRQLVTSPWIAVMTKDPALLAKPGSHNTAHRSAGILWVWLNYK